MILHLVTDEKFTDYAITHFMAEPATSVFVLVQRYNLPITHVKQKDQVRIIRYGSDDYKMLLTSLDQYACVFSHGLFEKWQEEVILHTPSSVKVAWMFWGGEVYGLPHLHNQFLSPSAKCLLALKSLMYRFRGKQLTEEISSVTQDTFNRINYCITDSREEFEYMNKHLGTNMQHIWYNYYSIEETVGALQAQTVNDMHILLGNSATFECNHLMAMRQLLRIGLMPAQQVILPLSYGDSWLRERLLQLGPHILRKHFRALTDYMPRDEYNQIMCSCGIVIMPHYRPQAFGNILTALWLGAKVFVSKKSISYPIFARLGLHVYTIEDDLTKEAISTPLSVELQQHNRSVLLAEYGAEAVDVRITNLIKLLNI